MHYSLFVPKAMGANPRLLDGVGLGHLLRDGDVSPLLQEMTDKGPDGGPGLLFVWPPEMPAYVPGQLTWQPAKPDPDNNLPGGRFWWGYDPAQPVSSIDLRRKVPLPGRTMPAGDEYWLMPDILLLPHKFALENDGKEVRRVAASHAAIYERGMWAYDLLKQQIEEVARAPGKELRQYVIEMLSLNYRMFRDLAYHLGLLTDESWFSLACATVDFETLVQIEEDVAKKKQALVTALTTPPTSTPGVGAKA